MPDRLKTITDHILYLPADAGTDRPLLAVISGKDKSLIIDSGNSSAHARLFLDEIKQLPIPAPEYVMITHWHWDHIFGIAEMDLPTIAHEITQKEILRLKSYNWTINALDKRVQDGIEIPFCADMIKKEFKDLNDIKIRPADILFKKSMNIDLGGISCIIEHIRCDHSGDSTVIFVPEDKVLFLGDCMGADIYHGKWSYDINTFLSLQNKIERYGAEVYVESHWIPESKKTFLSNMADMRLLALLAQKYRANEKKINKEAQEILKRNLTQDDTQTIEYFINGLEKEKV